MRLKNFEIFRRGNEYCVELNHNNGVIVALDELRWWHIPWACWWLLRDRRKP